MNSHMATTEYFPIGPIFDVVEFFEVQPSNPATDYHRKYGSP